MPTKTPNRGPGQPKRSPLNPIIGALQLAVGRGEGMARFASTVPAFMASLAPLIAFPLVAAVALVLSGHGVFPAASLLVLTVVGQLGPMVLSHALATRWGREGPWLRYATALNWCQWTIPVAAIVILIGIQIGTGGAVSESGIKKLLAGALAAYVLWLNFTLARHGLALSRIRAAALVVLVNVATIIMVTIPTWIADAFQ